MGGEGLAIDLADSLVLAVSPPLDLIADRATAARFWNVHAGALPVGWAAPSLAETHRLREAIRRLFDATQRGEALGAEAVATLDAFASRASASPGIALRDGDVERLERWVAGDPRDLALAAVARDAIDVLTGAARAALRRCASPVCSMLFVTGDARRRWCTPNICGNRDRAARHYRRHAKGG